MTKCCINAVNMIWYFDNDFSESIYHNYLVDDSDAISIALSEPNTI